MPQNNRPLPRSYWVHIVCLVMLLALLFALIGLTVFLTGGRDVGQFTRTDWMIFVSFFLTWLWALAAAFFIAQRSGRILSAHRREAFLSHLHEGLDPADDAFVLPDYGDDRRARITRTEAGYRLLIDRFDDASGWQPDGEPPRCFPSREALLHHLQHECDFCTDPEDPGLPPPGS